MGATDYFEKTYGKYMAKLPSKDAYLERIGLGGVEIPLTKEGLDLVQFKHLCSVPFENLDIFDFGKDIDFGIEGLFEKIVARKRGGYCFELNALYTALLEEIGFEVYPIGVRLVVGGGGFLPPINHRGAIVVIGGKRHFADVGCGSVTAAGESVCIDEDSVQIIRGFNFRVEDRGRGNKALISVSDEGERDMFIFNPEPFNILDFIAANSYMSRTGFRAKRIANLRTESGSVSVDGDILRRYINGQKSETPLESAQEAYNALTEIFGMEISEPLSESPFSQA
ncbi:MAG: arylamine N-acetyltransferase [Eubacteriaceae bacterium]|nr:arylamine N-acetyltransferase [Eubacteriaceae bacterium]